jgi:hypothetical protein
MALQATGNEAGEEVRVRRIPIERTQREGNNKSGSVMK